MRGSWLERVWVGAFLLSSVLVGCSDEASCPDGYELVAGRCVPPADAGADGGGRSVDAGMDAAGDDAAPPPRADAGGMLDGGVDGGCVSLAWYLDSDGDGYGDPDAVTEACDPPSGHVGNGDDCDDLDDAVYPGAAEACNGIDDDCDGDVDEAGATDESTWYLDADGDGHGVDSDTVTACTQPSGYAERPDDCNDMDTSVHPGAAEVCNGIDDDCDGDVDEMPSASEAPLCSDAATPVCFDGSCLCRPEITGIVGDYELLVPGHAYTLCGTCFDEVNRVRIGGMNMDSVTRGAAGCPAGEQGVRFTVPSSGIGGTVGLYAVVRGQGRGSPRVLRVVGELRVNEVKAGYDTYTSGNENSYVEVCAVDPRNRTMGLSAVSLRGYWVAVYAGLNTSGGSDGGLHASWGLASKATAPGGCIAIGHPGNLPVGFPASAKIALTGSDARFPEYDGGVVVGRDAVAVLAADLAGAQIVDAMLYDAGQITTDGMPRASLANLLRPGAARRVAVSTNQAFSTFARCGARRDALRDGRAWVVDRPLTLGQLVNDCP